MQPFLRTSNVIRVLIRQGYLYAGWEKFIQANSCPQMQQSTVVMSHSNLTHAIQEVEMNFILDVEVTKQEDVLPVEQWVLMAKRIVNTSRTEQEPDNGFDAESQEPQQRPCPPTPSVTSTIWVCSQLLDLVWTRSYLHKYLPKVSPA